MAKEKTFVELTNGTEIPTTKDGWSAEYTDAKQVLTSGWGSNPHFGVSDGILLAIAKQCPDLVDGEYQTANGEIPVINGIRLADDILQTYIEAKGLQVEKVRFAGSRSSVSSDLKSLGANPEVMAMIRATNQKLYDRISKLQ